jgi:hypothetical protein
MDESRLMQLVIVVTTLFIVFGIAVVLAVCGELWRTRSGRLWPRQPREADMPIALGPEYERLTEAEDRTLRDLVTDLHNIAALLEGQEQPVIARVAEDAAELRTILRKWDRLVTTARQRAARRAKE